FQLRKSGRFLFPAYVIIKFCRRRSTAFGILEDIKPVVADLLNQLHCFAEIFARFAGKPDDDITGYRHLASRVFHRVDPFQVIAGGVSATHGAQNSIAARLYRQMNPLAKIFILVDSRHDVRMKVARKGSRELYSLHPGRGDGAQQAAERSRTFETFQSVVGLRSIAVYVLPDEMNFLVAITPQCLNLGNDVRSEAALFATTRVRDDAVRTELITALDDRHKRHMLRSSIAGWYVPNFAFSAFIEVQHATFTLQRARNQLRQAIRGARARHDIHQRACIKNRIAFQLRDATHHADD